MPAFPIVDGHLVLPENVTLFGCDQTISAPEARQAVLGANWLRFLRDTLPSDGD